MSAIKTTRMLSFILLAELISAEVLRSPVEILHLHHFYMVICILFIFYITLILPFLSRKEREQTCAVLHSQVESLTWNLKSNSRQTLCIHYMNHSLGVKLFSKSCYTPKWLQPHQERSPGQAGPEELSRSQPSCSAAPWGHKGSPRAVTPHLKGGFSHQTLPEAEQRPFKLHSSDLRVWNPPEGSVRFRKHHFATLQC